MVRLANERDMSKQMIVNASATEEIRVAIVENNKLTDLDFETQSRAKQKGNIYKGIVANVEDSLEAAFIEFGEEKQGFLPLAEIRPGLYPSALQGNGKRRPKISEVLQRGQEIVVQITKDEIGQKGAAVTTYLSLPGRYVVLMHSDETSGGISRKIEDEQARRRARDILSRIDVPEGMAVIIRTAGMNCPRPDLYRDLQALARIWEQIDRGAQLGRAPTLLYREPDLVLRTIRDYLSPDIDKIVIDSEEEHDEARSYFEERMPDQVDRLELHDSKRPIFEAFGIERAIEELFQREVKLPSGGSIVIDQTEALVAIDVNSGRSTKEQDHEATVYKTNMEAAVEIARQLRLRDLGGIIVVDFIDMASRRHDRDVERKVKDAMRADRARVKVGRISENGTLEITRQRLRQAHRLISYTPCPSCHGTGAVRDPEGLAVSALRQIQGRLARSKKSLARVTVRIPVDVANVLNNKKRAELLELSEEHQLELVLLADARLQGDELRVEEEARGRAGLEVSHGIKDPRLDPDARRGRRGRRGRREEAPITPGASQPPPSIGPVPQFLADEESLFRDEEPFEDEVEAEDLDEAGEGLEGAERDVGGRDRLEAGEEDHFDDPLTEALLGAAPSLSLEEAEQPHAEAVEEPQRSKRRRRRRRRRGGREDRADNGALAELGADAPEGDVEDEARLDGEPGLDERGADEVGAHAESAEEAIPPSDEAEETVDLGGLDAARPASPAEEPLEEEAPLLEAAAEPEFEEPVAKPRARRRKAPAAAVSAPVNGSDHPDEEVAEAAPARRRRKKAPEVEAEEAPAAEAADDVAEKPKRRAPRRKKPEASEAAETTSAE